MVKIEDVIRAARELSVEDRAELLRRLLAEAHPMIPNGDEIDVGQRGLASLTESTRREDWSEHYPPSLIQRRRAG